MRVVDACSFPDGCIDRLEVALSHGGTQPVVYRLAVRVFRRGVEVEGALAAREPLAVDGIRCNLGSPFHRKQRTSCLIGKLLRLGEQSISAARPGVNRGGSFAGEEEARVQGRG